MSATVLVVDDSATVRQQVGAALRQAGLNVLEACDGEDGTSKIVAGGIDCVVCDVNMPNKTGLELVEEIKVQPQYKSHPIMMLTTGGGKESIARTKKAGMGSPRS